MQFAFEESAAWMRLDHAPIREVLGVGARQCRSVPLVPRERQADVDLEDVVAVEAQRVDDPGDRRLAAVAEDVLGLVDDVPRIDYGERRHPVHCARNIPVG